MCAGVVGNDELGVALGGVAGTGVGQPVHPLHEVAGGVPDGEDQDHAALEGLTHGRQRAESCALDALLLAVFLGGGAEPCPRVGSSSDGIADHYAILDVGTADLDQVTGGGTVVGDELGL